MLDTLLYKLKKIASSRVLVVACVFFLLFLVLLHRVFEMQIIEASKTNLKSSEEDYKSSIIRYTNSTRGNIFDRSGNLLAYNTLSYSVVMNDDGFKKLPYLSNPSKSELFTRNEKKNKLILKLVNILEENGQEPELDFFIEWDEKRNDLVFTVSDMAELRFKKNAYCLRSVNNLTEEQKNATAREVYEFLRIGQKNISNMFYISDEYSVKDTLKIMKIRYHMLILDSQSAQITIATDVNDVTVAAVTENAADLPGLEIQQQTSRVYNDSRYFAHIMGYTGAVNEKELEELNKNLKKEDSEDMKPVYNVSDVIGKTGIEKEMDPALRGTKGEVELTVNDSNRVINTIVKKEPMAGNDIYLTVDRELQIASYHILENNINALLLSKLVNSMSYGGKGTLANKITIPIYEVYNAFIANSILDISHFKAEDATLLERSVYTKFLQKRKGVLDNIKSLLDINSTTSKKNTSEEMGNYLDYVYSMLKESGMLVDSLVDKKSQEYLSYSEGNLSLSSFLQFAINSNWIDQSKLEINQPFLTTEELYQKLLGHLFQLLEDDIGFEKMIYRALIFSYQLSGTEVCLLLYDQGVLEYVENDYNRLKNGSISAYQFIRNKLTALEITPGMLALEPCSGSIVITDVTNGDVLALVTYPSYDNNKLANKIEWDYYQTLISNQASPLMNRPTQQSSAIGSTFKPLMSLAGIGERLITPSTFIRDLGIFTEVEPSPKCWKYPGSHGNVTMTSAIQHSCNYFFYSMGYRMSLDANGNYSDDLGLSKIKKYAKMFGLDDLSGIELPEAAPDVSQKDAVRSSIGYYHNFTPIQVARYVSTIANKGTVYDLTIVDKMKNSKTGLIKDNQAKVHNQITEFTNEEWDAVQRGMYNVVNTSANSLNTIYGNLGVLVSGKTGTAQVSTNHPSHGLFISYAPSDKPKISMTVVLPNGYSSANAAKLARELYGLYFNEENKEELLSGDLKTTTVTNINIRD